MLQLGMLHPERLIAFPRSHRLGDAGTTPDPVPFAFQTELLLQGWASSSVQRADPARTILSEVPYRPEKFMFVIHSEKLVQSSFLQNQRREPKIEVRGGPEPLGTWATGDAPTLSPNPVLLLTSDPLSLGPAQQMLILSHSVLSSTLSTPFFAIRC